MKLHHTRLHFAGTWCTWDLYKSLADVKMFSGVKQKTTLTRNARSKRGCKWRLNKPSDESDPVELSEVESNLIRNNKGDFWVIGGTFQD